jgi:hypothetical protein
MWRVLISTQKQARILISSHSSTAKTRLLSFNRTQSRVVPGMIAGHNTLRRNLYIMELIDSSLCRGCEAQEETSAHVFASANPWRHSDTPIWVSFSWTQRMLKFKSGGNLEL